MADLTFWLGITVVVLIVANAAISLIPKKGRAAVLFIPPNPTLSPSIGTDVESKLEAHILSTKHKLEGLFSRVESLEKRVSSLADERSPASDKTWLETVPVRNKPARARGA